MLRKAGELLLLFGVLLFQACEQITTTMCKKAIHNDDLELTLERITTRETALRTILQLEYRVENKSNEDIWVCNSNGRSTYPAFESKISKSEGKLSIIVKSFRVPDSVLFEAPLLAKFVKIAPGEYTNEKLLLKFPMYNHSPLGIDRNVKLSLNELRQFDIEIGYYTRNLEKECDRCYKLSIPGEIFVDCYWAAENEQKLIQLSMNM